MSCKLDIKLFVESLFEGCKIPNVSGIHVRMSDNSIWHIEIEDDYRGKIYVLINRDRMGYFKQLREKSRGYEYIFNQQYRVGIRNGLNEYEEFMKNICEGNQLILFRSASHV